jgi:hypothetical protein
VVFFAFVVIWLWNMFSKEMANEKEERAARDYFWGMESRTGGEWSGEE